MISVTQQQSNVRNDEFMVYLKATMCLKQNQSPKSPSLNTRLNILNGGYLHKHPTSYVMTYFYS